MVDAWLLRGCCVGTAHDAARGAAHEAACGACGSALG